MLFPLVPESDSWVDPVRLEANIVQTEGIFAETLERATRTLNVDPQTGFAPSLFGTPGLIIGQDRNRV